MNLDKIRNGLPDTLTLKEHTDHHAQICDMYGPVVDVWPSTNKIRATLGQCKAIHGDEVSAIKLAIKINRCTVKAETGYLKRTARQDPRTAGASPVASLVAELPFDAPRTADGPPPRVGRCTVDVKVDSEERKQLHHLLRLCVERLGYHGGSINEAICEAINATLRGDANRGN